MKILYIGDNASQFKPAEKVAQVLGATMQGSVEGHAILGARTLSSAQLSEYGIADSCIWTDIEHFLSNIELSNISAISLFLTGSTCYRFLKLFRKKCLQLRLRARPVVVSGYNGIVYEKHLEGLLWRTGSDVINVNCPSDYEQFANHLNLLGYPDSILCKGGFILSNGAWDILNSRVNTPIKRLIFATQSVVPRRYNERRYIYEALKDYAHQHPERQVVIKCRTVPGEQTLHVEELPFERISQQSSKGVPPNMYFAYGPIEQVFTPDSFLVSVSSTAVFDALKHGVPAGILTDVGIKESLGNHYFLGSGLFTNLQALAHDEYPALSTDWCARYASAPGYCLDELARRVAELVKEQTRTGMQLPVATTFYQKAVSPFIASGLIGADYKKVTPLRWVLQKSKTLYVMFDSILNSWRI